MNITLTIIIIIIKSNDYEEKRGKQKCEGRRRKNQIMVGTIKYISAVLV